MSTTVTSLLATAARRLGDPFMTRTKREDWLLYYNETGRKIAIELLNLEVDACFNIVAGEQRYAYPEDAVGIAGIRISETPLDLDSYYWLDELFRDEHRTRTDSRYPGGRIYGYYARQPWFELVGKPETDLTDGGLLTYYYTPATLTTDTDALMEFPDYLATFVVDGMIPRAQWGERQYAESAANMLAWENELVAWRAKIEDRSHDRRSSIRPPGYRNPTRGMV